jgi:hypothetical protein
MREAVPVLPAASRAVTVSTFAPLWSVTPETDQLVVPVAVPLPPRSFAHVTCVTATLSEAVPPMLTELELVLYVALEVGDVIKIEGAVVSGGV